MADLMADLSRPAATPAAHRATYTPTHSAIADGGVTLQAVTRDTDGVPFIAVTRARADGQERTTYDRADRVARYIQMSANQEGA